MRFRVSFNLVRRKKEKSIHRVKDETKKGKRRRRGRSERSELLFISRRESRAG